MASAAAHGRTLIELPLLDDLHLHVRDGAAMVSMMSALPGTVSRAIIMPNTRPPITTVAQAREYMSQILAARSAGIASVPMGAATGDVAPPPPPFTPLMTLYLTDNTPASEIDAAVSSGFIHGVKLYPAGATTNSSAGVTDIAKCAAALRRMAERDLPLLVHGEVTDPSVDVFDRERVWLRTVLPSLRALAPGLRIVLEHVTTRDAVEEVMREGSGLVATITAHHLLYNRNALFEGGIRPHRYCLPILKTEDDRQALIAAIASGDRRFFLGTDSAPHPRGNKECACGAAGMYTAHAAIELYAEAFVAAGALHHLKAFACENGADFYRLPRNETASPYRIIVAEQSWTVPDSYELGPDAVVVPAKAGETLRYKARVVVKE